MTEEAEDLRRHRRKRRRRRRRRRRMREREREREKSMGAPRGTSFSPWARAKVWVRAKVLAAPGGRCAASVGHINGFTGDRSVHGWNQYPHDVDGA